VTDTPDDGESGDEPRWLFDERQAEPPVPEHPAPPPPASVSPSEELPAVSWTPAETIEPAAAPAPAGTATAQAEAPRHRAKGKKKKERDRVRSTIEWVAVIVGALVVALVVKTFLFQAFYIPSASMEPTLKKGDRVLVNKLSYDLHDINRGDIVVFELPPEKVGPDGIKDLIKRVIGLPGDVIETRDGIVYINDKRLEEPYLPDGVKTDQPSIDRKTVPKDHIFVMGDNRDNSMDSRYESRGPIPIDTVVGRAFIQVWPPGDIGGL
jgi:signal peptidase I